jgi:hypothetical protein
MNSLPNEIIDKIVLYIEYPEIIKFRKYITKYAYYKTMSNDIIDIVKGGDITNLNYIKKDIDKIHYTIFDIIIIHSSIDNIENLLLWSYFNNYKYSIVSLNILSFLDCDVKKEIVLKFLYRKKYKFNKIHYTVGVKTNNIVLINFLIKIGIQKDHSVIDYSISQKNCKMIKFLIENNIGNDHTIFPKLMLMIQCNFENKMEFISWITQCSNVPINMKTIREMIKDPDYLQFVLINLLAIKNLSEFIKANIKECLKNLQNI